MNKFDTYWNNAATWLKTKGGVFGEIVLLLAFAVLLPYLLGRKLFDLIRRKTS